MMLPTKSSCPGGYGCFENGIIRYQRPLKFQNYCDTGLALRRASREIRRRVSTSTYRSLAMSLFPLHSCLYRCNAIIISQQDVPFPRTITTPLYVIAQKPLHPCTETAQKDRLANEKRERDKKTPKHSP